MWSFNRTDKNGVGGGSKRYATIFYRNIDETHMMFNLVIMYVKTS